MNALGRIGLALGLVVMGGCAARPREPQTLEAWIQSAGAPLTPAPLRLGALDEAFRRVQVVGLGEATHGQHESFELKRRLTLHLVREHGFRCVAYEASAASVEACDAYISGRSADRTAALDSLGMLIWQVEENGALLDELREWNRRAGADERVRFLGCDAQDGAAVARSLGALLRRAVPDRAEELERAARELVERGERAIQLLFTGQREEFDALQADAARVAEQIDALAASTTEREQAAELLLRRRELMAVITMYAMPGGRDRAMAELLLAQLRGGPSPERCVVWAHNAHVQRGPLGYLQSEELAMGGHLAAALGERYYAVGFAFGEGEFQANAPGPDGRWGYRRYRLSPAPEGSLEHALGRAREGDFALDLRSAPSAPAVTAWLDSGHGQRWFGGYGVPDDCDERTSDVATLFPTFPRRDFDALVYMAHTRAAEPLDPARLLTAPAPDPQRGTPR